MEPSAQVSRVAAYLRLSLDWEGKGLGIERQREDCEQIAARLGVEITDWYIDNSVGASRRSKSKGNRPEYRRLLADIEAGYVKTVIIWMEDRLHRQVIELAEFLKVCEAAGVSRIASVGGELNLSDPDQRTLLYIKAAMAEAEVEKISVRAKRKHQQEAEQGKRNYGGIRPMGEIWHGKQKISEERAAYERELIHEAVNRLIAGDSLRGIAVDWTKRGEQTPAGGSGTMSTLGGCCCRLALSVCACITTSCTPASSSPSSPQKSTRPLRQSWKTRHALSTSGVGYRNTCCRAWSFVDCAATSCM